MSTQTLMFWSYLSLSIHLISSLSASIHAVLYKRESRVVIGWIGLIWLAPITGACLYLVFGVNRIHRKAVALRGCPLRTGSQENSLTTLQEHSLEPQTTQSDGRVTMQLAEGSVKVLFTWKKIGELSKGFGD
jgi:hypothetical protein